VPDGAGEILSTTAVSSTVRPPKKRITSGTGRLANASGTFTVVQTRGLSMPYNNSATIDGTINLGR
jgi:hypothetical protein